VTENRIDKLAYRVKLRDKDIPIAIKVFLDGSGQFADDYITLAAFAGNDEMWEGFEDEWVKILNGHIPPAKYVHMRELVRQIKWFDRKFGWTPKNSFALVFKCLMYMQRLDKKRFRMFRCSVDLAAWRKLKAETYQLPEPLEIFTKFCFECIVGWYFLKHPDILDPMNGAVHFFFDKDEPFRQPFEDKWKSETKNLDARRGDWNAWTLVKEVAAVEMRDVPGVQAADILAWSANREGTQTGDIPGISIAEIMRQVIPSGSIEWNEERFRRHYDPLIHHP
jgi:hypothetical protein